jgi:hypothetical protein
MLLGALAATVRFWQLWPEVWQRLTWRGGGESGDWGEPAFYLLYLLVPGGLVGSVVGAVAGLLRKRRAG